MTREAVIPFIDLGEKLLRRRAVPRPGLGQVHAQVHAQHLGPEHRQIRIPCVYCLAQFRGIAARSRRRATISCGSLLNEVFVIDVRILLGVGLGVA